MRKNNKTFRKVRLYALLQFFMCYILCIVATWSQAQLGTSISGEAAGDNAGRSVSINASGDIIAIGASFNDDNGVSSGHVRMYQNTAGTWTQLGADIDGGANDEFGSSVSLNAAGSIVAVGGYSYDPTHSTSVQTGIVRVYENVGGTWTQIGSDFVGATVDDQLGSSVSLNSAGTIVAMSAIGGQYVSVYENIAGTWTQIGANITGNIHETSSHLSLNATGDILSIGFNGGSGSVKIYKNIVGTWTQIGSGITGEASGDRFGASVSLNAAGDIVVIGGRLNDGSGSNSGHVRVYQNISNTWTQIGADIDGEAAGDQFGISVSMNDTGDVIVIGGLSNDGNGADSGHVRVYQNLLGVWTQVGTDIDGATAGDNFGTTVSLNAIGNILVAGAPLNDDNGVNSGHVGVFQNNITVVENTTQVGTSIPGEAAGDLSGSGISINTSGNIIAIGAPFNDGNGINSGHVRIYQNTAGVWTQLGADIDGDGTNSRVGSSVSLNAAGTIVAVGAPGTSSLGGVQVYEYVGGVWTQVGTTIFGTTANDEFGTNISLNSAGTILASSSSGGDYVAIYENVAGTWTQIGANISASIAFGFNAPMSLNAAGNIVAIGETDGNGLVKVYKNIAGTWTQVGSDITGEASGDLFGYSVSMNAAGDVVVIGGYKNDGNGVDSGHVRVYQNISGTWTQIGSDIDGEAVGDEFGYSVSMNDTGDVIAVGALRNDDNGANSGHVRVYQNLLGVWTQIGVDIDGVASGDLFGASVSLNATGNIFAGAALHNDDNGASSGHVRVFQNNINVIESTTQVGTSIPGEGAGDNAGHSVSINASGDIIAMGAPFNDDNGLNSGVASVYQNISGIWTQLADIDGDGFDDELGSSVSLNAAGSIIAIGGKGYSSPASSALFNGIVRVYENVGGVWTQIGTDFVGVTATDQLGSAVSLNSTGTIVAMSAAGGSYVSVYENIAGTWNQIGVNITGTIPDSNSSLSLNAAGDILSIGFNDGSGLVKVYKNIAGTWTQVGSDITGEASGDEFGSSVSMNTAGDIVAIGGSKNDGNGVDSGHVRVYQNISNTWTQIGADIDGEAAGDRFGASVSMNDTGDIIVIGGSLNDGNGVDGGQVRIYQNLLGIWTQVGTDIDGASADDHFGTSVSLNATGNILVSGAPLNDDNGVDSGHVRVLEFESDITLKLQAFLSGPYNTSTNLMNDDLRVAGVIPSQSPYGDGAYLDSDVFSISGGNAIVDWVLIELRDKNDINTVLETKGALLQRDGDIVDVDGYSNLSFIFKNDSYFVSISHRNHINVVTDAAQNLSELINFKTASNLRGTTNAVAELTTGVYGLIAGEVSGDGQIQTTDYGSLSVLIGQTGYRLEDVNMDNQIQTTDITKLLAVFGSGIQF